MNLLPGRIVTVPFGRSPTTGVVIDLTSIPPDFPVKPVKKIISDITIPPHLISLAKHVARYYFCSLGQAIFAMVPGFVLKKNPAKPEKIISLPGHYPDPALIKKYSGQWELWQYILRHPDSRWMDIRKRFSPASLKSLVKKNYLEISLVDPANRANDEIMPAGPLPDLLPEQSKIYQKIKDVIARPNPRPVLLFGRTGSGKTEIYLRCAQDVIKSGRPVIILVPEIALVPQTIARFYEVFGSQLAVYHSQLPAARRREEWYRIYQGRAKVVVGSRSALFAPFRPGLIIIDEEHEYSYKQDGTPRYHAVDVAVEYARQNGAGLILGSATPRVESFWWAKREKYHLFKLNKTIQQLLHPDIKYRPKFTLADLRQEFATRNYSTISLPLHVAIQSALERKKQTMLMLNRRGHTSYVFCRLCGYVARCPSCSVSLTLHLQSQSSRLICHHCGYQVPNHATCPQCHSPSIRYYGAGTQRVEKDILELFPEARILRMDHDTTRTKDAHRLIFDQFRQHRADILIGTQMIAKGWNIPNADLIGIINADAGWHLPDFRATEKNFSLLMQIIGRVGRFDGPGEVVVQTYEPENPLFEVLRQSAYQLFAFSELIERKRHNFPPFTRLVRLVYEHSNLEKCRRQGIELFSRLNQVVLSVKNRTKIEILGPAPAYFSKINNRFRWHIILKGDDLHHLLPLVPSDWIIDVDPFSLL